MPRLEKVTLDVGMNSSLRWDVSGDEKTLWELSLGEFDPEDEMHLQTLLLGLNHFTEHVWKRYGGAGIILYRGLLPLSDIQLRALEALGAALPVTPMLELDARALSEEAFYFQSAEDRFPHFHVTFDGGYPLHSQAPLGLCLPASGTLGELLTVIPRPFRVIPEKLLIYKWEGLDTLIVLPKYLTPSGRRKVQGFLAAGGEVINYPDDAAALQLRGSVQPSSLAASTQSDQ